MAVERVAVEVVFALPDWQRVVPLELPLGSTVLNAVERSRLLETVAAGERARCRFGVHGTPCAPGTLLRDGDRVEIYRPLPEDPKARRRRRARARSDR